jgi:hypothetical protein
VQRAVQCRQRADDPPRGTETRADSLEPDGDAMKHKCFLSFQVPTEDGTNLVLVGYQAQLVKVDGAWKLRIRQVGPLKSSAAGPA